MSLTYKRNLKGIVQYDGTSFSGWQIQKKGNTIQGNILNAIRSITGEDVVVQAAGRTDAGVHAIGQVISFKTNYSKDLQILKKGINAILPYTIRLSDVFDMPMDFHPRYDAKSKTYFYLVSLSDILSPFIYPYVWHLRKGINITKMLEASRYLVGQKDFGCFMASGATVKDTTRNIMQIRIEIIKEIGILDFLLSDNLLKFEIKADGFLRHMVRNIVGTLVEVGTGRFPVEHVDYVIKSKDRRLAGITAPAKGLFLHSVEY